MGKGREIGAQLNAWLARGERRPLQARVLEGVMLDALGADARLRGPVRDLALQPLLVKLLQEPSAAARRSMLDALSQDLASTYATPVLHELLDLLEAATGVSLSARPDGTPFAAAEPAAQVPVAGPSPPRRRRPRCDGPRSPRQLLADLGSDLLPLAPGVALGFANALVLQWVGGELGRLLPRTWSSGLLLALTLVLLQVLLLRPLARLRRLAPLILEDCADPHRAWRWITAPWVHHRPGEAWLNALMLLILLGESPLSLDQLLLRYLLTTLATMLPAVLLARRWLQAAIWDGATGAVAALIALATGVSLLHWRPFSFPFGVLTVPCWVLLLVYGAIQMGWVLPRLVREETASPWQRLLCSCWGWGTIWGLLWALLTRLLEWAEPLLRAAGRG